MLATNEAWFKDYSTKSISDHAKMLQALCLSKSMMLRLVGKVALLFLRMPMEKRLRFMPTGVTSVVVLPLATLHQRARRMMDTLR